MMENKRLRRMTVALAWVLIVMVSASGCSTLKSDEAQPAGAAPKAARESTTVYHDFGDVMVPSELQVNTKDSFVMHTTGATSGVLVLSGKVDGQSLVSFFENNMPRDGWRKTGAFKSARSLILFNKQNRWCVISISEGRFKTHVEIWVAPSLDEAGVPLTR
jgi:hypothetical protein